MPARSFSAEQEKPHTEEECRKDSCDVRLNYQRCAQQRFQRHGNNDPRVGLVELHRVRYSRIMHLFFLQVWGDIPEASHYIVFFLTYRRDIV